MYKVLETIKNEDGKIVNEIVLTDECQQAGCENKLKEPEEIDH